MMLNFDVNMRVLQFKSQKRDEGLEAYKKLEHRKHSQLENELRKVRNMLYTNVEVLHRLITKSQKRDEGLEVYKKLEHRKYS